MQVEAESKLIPCHKFSATKTHTGASVQEVQDSIAGQKEEDRSSDDGCTLIVALKAFRYLTKKGTKTTAMKVDELIVEPSQ